MSKRLGAIIGVLVLLVLIVGVTSANKTNKAEELLTQARECVTEGNYKEALSLANQSHALRASDEVKELIADWHKLSLSQDKFNQGLSNLSAGKYHEALEAFKQVIKQDTNYAVAQEKITETSHKYADTLLKEAKTLYSSKDHIKAYQTLRTCLHLNPQLVNAKQLEPLYKTASESQEKAISIEAEKQRKLGVISTMKKYEFGLGQVGIAVTNTKTSSRVNGSHGFYHYVNDPSQDQYVWLLINAVNNGSTAVHINPNDFTLSVPGGYAAGYDESSFLINYLDATDVPPGSYVAGWLIFILPKSGTYTLYYEGWGGSVVKDIVVN